MQCSTKARKYDLYTGNGITLPLSRMIPEKIKLAATGSNRIFPDKSSNPVRRGRGGVYPSELVLELVRLLPYLPYPELQGFYPPSLANGTVRAGHPQETRLGILESVVLLG